MTNPRFPVYAEFDRRPLPSNAEGWFCRENGSPYDHSYTASVYVPGEGKARAACYVRTRAEAWQWLCSRLPANTMVTLCTDTGDLIKEFFTNLKGWNP